nr:GspE/PulE family protein [Clostridium sp. BJN0001]
MDLYICERINKTICEKYKIIPFKEEGNSIIILCLNDKVDDKVKNYLKIIYKDDIKFTKIDEKTFYYLKSIIYDLDFDNLLDYIIQNAVLNKASDIHIEPHEKDTDIRYRINGMLQLMYKINKNRYIKLISKIKNDSNMDITNRRNPQDGKMRFILEDIHYDLRISSIPLIFGEKIVIRIIYKDKTEFSLKNLYLSEKKVELIKRMISLKTGLILINGPTGSGKSTSLAAILKELDGKNVNITTIEDPVEIIMPHVNQMNLNEKIGITFESGLRSILRQDPDIIMVGEIRDKKTAEMAIRSSITGHKVLSTIHTSDAKEVFERLSNMGIDRYLIDECISGIISQRLIRILCDECKEIDKEHSKENCIVYKKKGCSKCNYSGYGSRRLISSVYLFKGKDSLKSTDIDKISNKDMIYDLDNLLKKGMIGHMDYMDFIKGEGIL